MLLAEDLKNKFKNLVNTRCGLYFKDYDLKDLENAIRERMACRKVDSQLAYYNILTISQEKEDEFRELLNLLTIKHTYFFRNEPQFKAIKEKILPALLATRSSSPASPLINQKQKPNIRIWSAGCSTGEEPYSIAMVIRDVIPDLEQWDIQILATDVSTNALDKAKIGIYGKNAIKSLAKEYIDKYFIVQADSGQAVEYRLKDEIKRMVNFDYFNLMESDYPGGFDIILCRNVVIYFELETTIKVMNKFFSSLKDDGYLFIGYSESLQFISDKFKMGDYKDAIFYRKSEKEAVAALKTMRSSEEELDEILEEISRAEVAAKEKDLEAISRQQAPAKNIGHLLIQIIKHLHAKQYGNALALIEEAHKIDKNAVDPYYLAAEVYANQGRFSEAKDELRAALSLSSLFTPAHYLFGSIYFEEENLEEAKKSLKKALYLDQEFSLAHFSLANVYKNEGQFTDAIREYRNALKILAKSSPSDIIAYSGGFNSATLISVCKNNIERLKYM